MNLGELKFWLDWYDRLEQVLGGAAGAVLASKDGDGHIRLDVSPELLPQLHRLRDLFVEAGSVKVFDPLRGSTGTQVWPANAHDAAASAPLVRLVEEPAYLAQEDGFRAEEPGAPRPLERLIDLLEAQEHGREVARDAAGRCEAWGRIVPELFADGLHKVLNEALPCFDLLPADAVAELLRDLSLPREIMSPFLAYVDRPLHLRSLVRREDAPAERHAAD